MRPVRPQVRSVAAVVIVASLALTVLAIPTVAGAWTRIRPAAAPSSWAPGKGLAATSSFVLSAWASDCPPPRGVCAKNSGPRMGVFAQRARSRAGGLPWGPAKRVSPKDRHAERATIAADGTRVIVGWVTQLRYLGFKPAAKRVFQVRRSNDQGRTWGRVMTLSASTGRVDYPRLAIVGNRVYAVWTDAKNGDIRLATSNDGGATWNKKTVGTTTATAGRPREGRAGLPDIGASGQNVAITWYTNQQGRQVVKTSGSQGNDLNASSPETVLTASSPPNGIRYGGAAGATDAGSDRVAVAYTTGSGLSTRVWDGSTLSQARVVTSWPVGAGGQSYADGFGPAILPTGATGLMVAFAGCRPKPGDACQSLQRPARIDVLVMTSGDDGQSWSAPTRLTDAGKQPYRTNAEPSLVHGGPRFRVSFNRYQSSFSDYRVWARSSD